MKPSPIRALFPWLSLLLLAVVAGAPLLSATRVPGGYDTLFHFWRAVQAERLLREGALVPRWAPDMAGGYGYPLFIFQGTLSSQLAALLRLAGMAWPLALNGAYFIGVLGSALALFLLARTLWGDVGGWGAAACFLFVPYHLYVAYYRGSLSETMAWIFPPLVLWGLTCWIEGRRRGLVVGAVALMGLALTHPVSLYLFAPLFGLWMLAEAGGVAPEQRRAALRRGILLLALGVGLGAFAWAPGLLERDFVQLGRATSAWVFSYRENFLPLDQLLSLPRSADPRLLNDWPARGLGALFCIAALGGALTWFTWDRRARLRLLALTMAMLVFVFLALDSSTPLWEALPFLAAFQFPWRFLAPASLMMVLLISAGLAALARLRRYSWIVWPVVGVLAMAHWGWLYPPTGGLPGPASPAGLVAWEQATDTIGTTASRELLPCWVEEMPAGDNSLTTAVLENAPLSRLDEAVFPEGMQVLSTTYRAMAATLRIDVPRAFQARYLAFYYPGWRVKVDGISVEVTPEPETGLLTFPVPAGRHTLKVWFGETPLRWATDGISVMALVVALFVSVGRKSKGGSHAPKVTNDAPRSVYLGLPFLALALLVVKILVFDRAPMLWRRSRLEADGSLSGVTAPLNVNFGGRAVLLGMDPPPAASPADATLEVTFYWRALNPEGRDWQLGLAFTGPDGSRWMPEELRPARWGRVPPPMSEWPPDMYARVDDQIDIPAGMPPGVYTMTLSLFDRRTLEPASVLGADGNPLGPELAVGQIRLRPPRRIPTLAALDVPADAELHRCGSLGLWSMTVDRTQAAPGDLVALRWVWEAVERAPSALEVTLDLRDAAGAAVRSWQISPSAAWWPTDRWQAGDRWVGLPLVRLPGSLGSGVYTFEARLPGCAQSLASMPLTVVAPERRWTIPDGFTPTDVALGEVAHLAGFTVSSREVVAGDPVKVSLAWQALAEMETSYRVFLHIVGPEGQALAQSDGEPAGWTRPTTGWAVGEVVLDEREVAVPADAAPGDYEIRVGLYIVGGARLLTADGQDAVSLGVLHVR